MDRAAAFDRFREVIVDVLDVEPDCVVPEARWEDLDADSLAVVEISLALGDAFGIKVPDVPADELATVGLAFELVAGLVGAT